MALPSLNRLTSNLNSLIFFKNPHWKFDLDWQFKIWTGPGFVQNLIRGLRYYRYIDCSGKFFLGPRVSKSHLVNLPGKNLVITKIYIISY